MHKEEKKEVEKKMNKRRRSRRFLHFFPGFVCSLFSFFLRVGGCGGVEYIYQLSKLRRQCMLRGFWTKGRKLVDRVVIPAYLSAFRLIKLFEHVFSNMLICLVVLTWEPLCVLSSCVYFSPLLPMLSGSLCRCCVFVSKFACLER